MRSLQSVLDLLTSKSKVATKIMVERIEKHPVHGSEWMMYPPFHPWTDASTLTIERNGTSRRASQNGVAVLHQHEQVQTIGLASYFIDSKIWVNELAGLDRINISESEVAGRDVLILPLSDLALSIDAKYGVVLAAEDSNELVRAVSVEFLDQWVDEEEPPAEEVRKYTEAREELPPLEIPPAPSGNRNLRVLCTWGAMEGIIPEWKPGDQVSLFLSFNLDDPPFEQLKTTRRGYTEPGEIYENQRSYKFHADGWNAVISTKVPLRTEENLTGYFTHSSYADTSRRTSAVITAVYRHGQDAIIDVTLDGAKPPRYQEPLDWSSTSTCDGETFWLSDKSLPLVRGFNVSTGKLVHEISIPTFNEIALESGNRARAAKKLWELPDLKEVTDLVPAIPAGWKLHKRFGKNFHVVSADNGTWKQTILRIKPFKAIELDLGYAEISTIYQYGERIYLRSDLHQITFNQDLEILSVEVHGNPDAGYWPLSDLPPGDSPTLGFPIGSLMMFHERQDIYAFHDPKTTKQLTTVNLPKRQFEVEYASQNRIVISLKNPESRLIDKLLVWEPQTGWREQNLER
ncbi:hypothetical protein [Corynebacterium glutamicum]|uniref:hypothetical protein n=1 Tax=Corynebacterium glutamicum TaxID=1718 RepID=UPI000744D45A|nr:hypothetical protein [Corynebacterium glutamicum]AMA01102.1 hypothetical protein APT58_13180 [Corynebacterium glutamicum]